MHNLYLTWVFITFRLLQVLNKQCSILQQVKTEMNAALYFIQTTSFDCIMAHFRRITNTCFYLQIFSSLISSWEKRIGEYKRHLQWRNYEEIYRFYWTNESVGKRKLLPCSGKMTGFRRKDISTPTDYFSFTEIINVCCKESTFYIKENFNGTQ